MNEADQHLLQLIRAGERDGWNQFIARFQRRLIAFAIRQVDQLATAEDLVQETFVGFLNSVSDYRNDCELESFLFQILRRRIIDHYRRQGSNREISACSLRASPSTDASENPLQQVASPDMHASWYARRNEARDIDQQLLSTAIHQLATKLQVGERFRDLKIAEGLFYAGCRNQQLAQLLQLPESEIRLVKHRLLKRLAQSVRDADSSAEVEGFTDEPFGGVLTTVWESERPSCPKRTTLGKFTLGLLPLQWNDFLEFHINVLGCRFCAANLHEMDSGAEADATRLTHDRLYNSTVGFLTR